jgi:ribosome maturation factor RimP
MISVSRISSLVDPYFRETGIFLVDAEIRKGNHIRVFIDSLDGVTVEDCVKVSRIIESGLDRETEDFDLEVSSPGLDAPLKVFPQYLKNMGKNVAVIKNDGIKIAGKLLRADKQGIEVEVHPDKNDKQVKTRPVKISNEYILFSDIKTTRILINF